jgi:guanosine-3',5'-bis(diphosphate) 3'-pyrophosphohydrolase
MLLAMASDLRVILIKLADRLHNMRTLDHMRPDKRRRIARETQEIHAPIANRLGLNSLYRELQELAFKHRYPMRFRVLSKAILAARGNRREVVGKILAAIEERLPQWNIEAEVWGREKHLYSIYRKMTEKRLSSRRCSISTVSASWCPTCRPATAPSARCTASTSRCPASSRTTSRSPRPTATSRCTPR